MRTAQLLLTIVLLTCAVAAARPLQGPMGGPPGLGPDEFGNSTDLPSVNSQLKRLTRMLKLSDDQQRKVRSILEDQKLKFKKLEQADSDDDSHSVRELQDETSANIRELLNEDQKAKFDAYEKKQQEAREQRGDGMPPPPPPF